MISLQFDLHKLASIFLLLVSACGLVKVGDSTTKEPIPVGIIIAQAPFTAQNSQSLSGTALIYRLTSDASYVVRIENLVAPNESNLQVRVKVGGQIVERFSLKSYLGNQNYSSSQSGTLVWDSVDIYSIPNDQVYGISLFQ